MANPITIAAGLALPLETVTQTFAILSKRGMGKTYTALVLVEELLQAGQPVVVLDPVGVCWGLRAAANGTDPGLPIIVMGGDHGDVPLEPSAGKVVADFVVNERQAVVLDLSLLRKGEQVRFVQDFAETLYHRNRLPLHIVLDEADAFAPQRPMPGEQRMLGAVEDLVRRGRARGIGITLVTQRAAVLNKNVLTQVEVLVTLRTIAPQDREAIDAWVKIHGTPEQREKLMASLPSLPVGTAWIWSPGWLDLFRCVQIRARKTFDSSATPKAGQRRAAPKQLATVDLESLKVRIAATIEKAKADDPKELRRRIAELDAEIRKRRGEKAALPDVAAIERARAEGQEKAEARQRRDLQAILSRLIRSIEALNAVAEEIRGSMTGELQPATIAPVRDVPPRSVPPRTTVHSHAPSGNGSEPAVNGAGPRKILTVLAQYSEGRTKRQIAILAGYAVGGGAFNNYLSNLRTKGWIDGREPLRITPAGVKALGSFEPLPTGDALRTYWMAQLGQAERQILHALCGAFPRALTKAEVAEATPSRYEPTGGGFNNAISRLRTLELVQGRGELRASEELFS